MMKRAPRVQRASPAPVSRSTARAATRWPESVQPPATSASTAIETSALRLDVCGLGRGRGVRGTLALALLRSRARLLGGCVCGCDIGRLPGLGHRLRLGLRGRRRRLGGGERFLGGALLRLAWPLLLLAHARLLADLAAEVVELRAADVADRLHLDLVDLGRMQGERPLDADAEGLLADGERLARASALALDHDALEDLDPAALALDHLEVHADGVARLELGQVRAQLALLDGLDEAVHGKAARRAGWQW